jgi:hypothetical protein
MHTATLRCLILVDPLLLQATADGPAKSDADIERHRLQFFLQRRPSFSATACNWFIIRVRSRVAGSETPAEIFLRVVKCIGFAQCHSP